MDQLTAPQLKEALDDYQALTLTIWGEASGLTQLGRLAVGCAIANRKRKRFRGSFTFKSVCLARLQFSCWFPAGGEKNYLRLMAMSRRMVRDHSDTWPASLKECADVAKEIIAGDFADLTDGATHYYLEGTKVPSWSRPPAVLTVEIEGHLFYRNVA